MPALLEALAERKAEFDSHLAFAMAVEERLVDGDPVELGAFNVGVRHLMTIKSGLIIHLYNIVEALMTKAISGVATAVQASPPGEWSPDTLREWLRYSASIDLNGNEDSRLKVVHGAARKLLQVDPIDSLNFKKPSGTWSDKVIVSFSKRLNVNFPLNKEIAAVVKKEERYGGRTPLEFLADRRNDIAHGVRTFEHGAQDLTLSDISELYGSSILYMEHAIAAFELFIKDKKYLSVKN